MTQTEIESIISLCRMVQEGSIEPFDIDFEYVMSVIKKNFDKIDNIENFCIDAEALKEVSNVLEKQNQWIAHKSTTLYKDPFMLHQQLMNLDISAIADILLKSWHPIVELNQVSAQTLVNSLGYWGELIPLNERYQEPKVQVKETGFSSREEAYYLGLLPEEGFTEILEKFWKELEVRAGKGGIIDYWDWIGANTYEETIIRSYLTVFLVSYGYAKISYDRLLEETNVIHNVEVIPDPSTDKKSLLVMVDYEEWKKWREG